MDRVNYKDFSQPTIVSAASTLGWPPGHWPKTIVLETCDGRERTLTMFDESEDGCSYQDDEGVVLIAND